MAEEIKKEEEGKDKNPSASDLPTHGAGQSAGGGDAEKDRFRAQAEEYLDGWKRAKADLINYKKDEEKRFQDIIRFANQGLVSDLVAVLDSFDLAIGALSDESKVEKGIYMIRAQLWDVLKKHGLEKISVTAGDVFDPSLHEAVMAVECSQSSGTIVEEVETGYLLSGKTLRPARVKVAK